MSKVTFQPPAGAVPEGVKEGDTFDLVSTFRVEQDGRVCLTQMGDVDMGYDDKGSGKRDYSEDAKEMTQMGNSESY